MKQPVSMLMLAIVATLGSHTALAQTTNTTTPTTVTTPTTATTATTTPTTVAPTTGKSEKSKQGATVYKPGEQVPAGIASPGKGNGATVVLPAQAQAAQERTDAARIQRAERSVKAERPEKVDKPHHNERPEKVERPLRIGHLHR